MSELDAADGYTIRSASVYSEAAYLSVTRNEHSVEHKFRPVDASDGLQMYNISGNHECIGNYADELPQYVSSGDGGLYYTVKFGNAFSLVLDTALDKMADNHLFKPSSIFEIRREEQAERLNGLIYLGEDCEYRFSRIWRTRFPSITVSPNLRIG